jgi:hypothetical protein
MFRACTLLVVALVLTLFAGSVGQASADGGTPPQTEATKNPDLPLPPKPDLSLKADEHLAWIPGDRTTSDVFHGTLFVLVMANSRANCLGMRLYFAQGGQWVYVGGGTQHGEGRWETRPPLGSATSTRYYVLTRDWLLAHFWNGLKAWLYGAWCRVPN